MAEITKEQVVEVLKSVYDPEIPVNVFDLGLIYDVDVEGREVNVVMTLTSPSCPSAQQIPQEIESRIRATLSAEPCLVHVVWSPPWSPARISAEGRKLLGMDEWSMPDEDPEGGPATPPPGPAD